MRQAKSELVHLPALLTTWDHYLPIYVYKERTEVDELNPEIFYEGAFLDLMM